MGRRDRGFFNLGTLQVNAYVSYPDTDMPDGFYNKMHQVSYEIDEQIEIINKDIR